jgi:hypothetical protein
MEIIEEPIKLKCIIAGSRHITDYDILEFAIKLCPFKDRIVEIVSGRAAGPDTLGEQYADNHSIKLKKFPADWDKFGKRAGYLRNEEMAKYADAAIILWDGTSKGTKHMIDLSKKYNLELYICEVK